MDDKAFGMHGQVLSPEPLAEALDDILSQHEIEDIYYFSPRGEVLTQDFAETFSKNTRESILIC